VFGVAKSGSWPRTLGELCQHVRFIAQWHERSAEAHGLLLFVNKAQLIKTVDASTKACDLQGRLAELRDAAVHKFNDIVTAHGYNPCYRVDQATWLAADGDPTDASLQKDSTVYRIGRDIYSMPHQLSVKSAMHPKRLHKKMAFLSQVPTTRPFFPVPSFLQSTDLQALCPGDDVELFNPAGPTRLAGRLDQLRDLVRASAGGEEASAEPASDWLVRFHCMWSAGWYELRNVLWRLFETAQWNEPAATAPDFFRADDAPAAAKAFPHYLPQVDAFAVRYLRLILESVPVRRRSIADSDDVVEAAPPAHPSQPWAPSVTDLPASAPDSLCVPAPRSAAAP
jgi:hypothetical protein